MTNYKRLAGLALQLCRIRSPTGAEKEIADYIEQWARSIRPPKDVFRNSNSLVIGDLTDSRPAISLIGHLDTVPCAQGAREPSIDGDRLFGRGSSDMKGGVAVMMALFESLPLGLLHNNLILTFYEREEGPFLDNGLAALLEKTPALRRVQFGIVLEPTDNVVQIGCAGSLHATLRFSGHSAHSARPWEGENALHKAGLLLAELHARSPHKVVASGLSFYEVFSATLASGGTARNVVPDCFTLNLNYRFAPDKNIEQAKKDVYELVQGRALIEYTDIAPAGRACIDNLLTQKLIRLTGQPPAPKQAWTDVARLTEAGIDAVNFGPGETAQAHQENESSSVTALGKTFEILEQFLQSP